MLLIPILLFLLGILFLYGGAEFLVKGSSRLAIGLGIRPIIVGLTIVAMGTSSPELAVSLLAAVKGTKDFALGNIIGSNIANIGLVVGLAAVINPLKIQAETIRREMPFLITATILLYVFSLDGVLGFIDGLVLFIGFIGFITYVIILAKKDRKAELEQNSEKQKYSIGFNIFLTLIGLVILLAGSYIIVISAEKIAEILHISPIVIAITMIAVGTSLPELAISSVSAYRGHVDLAVGNAVGSNIFNTLLILALVAMLYPIPVDKNLLYFEYPAMLFFTIIFLPMMRTGFIINRWEGGILLVLYSVFTFLLF